MTNKPLNFNFEREGFPVNIGGIEFFFGTAVEDLQRFFSLQEETMIKINALQTKIDKLKASDDGEISKENVEKTIELTKELTRIHYDAMLGDGCFDKIYAIFPYADVLLDNFDPIAESVAKRIEKETDNRADKYNKKRAELLKKKALKNKKKK